MLDMWSGVKADNNSTIVKGDRNGEAEHNKGIMELDWCGSRGGKKWGNEMGGGVNNPL